MRKRIKKLTLVVILIVILLVAFFWPLPDYIEGPGDADNLKSMVTVKRHPDHDSGEFMLTSVAMAPAHPLTYCWAKFNPHYSIINEKEMTGNQNNQTFDRVQQFYMQNAINMAIYTAFKKAHRYVKNYYHGIYIVEMMNHSHFHSLKVGDTITSINHHHFRSTNDCQRYLNHQPARKRVTISYLNHRHAYRSSTAKLMPLPGERKGIGVLLTDDSSVQTHLPVHVNPEQIGGPSGGLMFTLQLYDQLTGLHLKRGRKIAGTGTINQSGQVGEIGGIDKKIIAAHRKGATIFFAPYVKPSKAILKIEPHHLTNYQMALKTARKYAPHMKIIPVTNFSNALHYLEK